MAVEMIDALKGKNAEQIRDVLAVKSAELQKLFSDNKKDGQLNLTKEQIEEVKTRNNELTDIGKALDGVREVERIEAEAKSAYDKWNTEPIRPTIPNGGNGGREMEGKAQMSFGERFVQEKAYLDMIKSGNFRGNPASSEFNDVAVEVKTTMTTAAGFAPANDRTGIVVVTGTAQIVIQDLIPSITTNLDAIKYMDETTFTNNAAEVAENAAMAESAIAFTERTQPVEMLGTFLPVTEQQLETAEAVRGIIDQRLMKMYMLKEQSQLIAGSGTTPALLGFLNKVGIQSQALGGDNVPDCLYKLVTKLRGGGGSGFVEPSAFVLHPNDWQAIRLLTDLNGQYLWGSPSEAGPERIWGKPVVVTTAITENTGLAGDFQGYSQIWRKRGARIDAGFQNDDFVKNKLTLKVTGRLALVIYRAAAFGTATGI